MKSTLLLLSSVIITLIASSGLQAQGRVVLNGGQIKISNGAALVVANNAANAITRNSGHIVSEGQNNQVKWNIGTTAATYIIPWGTSTGSYIPLSFTTSGAAGASGYFSFATYQTTSQNSSSLPAGVSNFNSSVGIDASLTAVDRFWKMEPVAYTTRPALSNLNFTYPDAEYALPNKILIENKLTARRWNATLATWQDYITGGVANIATNTVRINSLPGTELQPWWSLQYPGASYHWIATTPGNVNLPGTWSLTIAGSAAITIPGPGDAIFFDDARDGNSVLTTLFEVGQLTVAPGYSGTITQGIAAVNIDGDANFGSGTFIGSGASFNVNGSLNITGGAFTATSGTTDIKGNLNVSNTATFAHNNGTFQFSGTSGTQTINAPGVAFRSITATNTSASTGLVFESNNQLMGVLSLGNNVVVDPDGASNNRVLTLASSADSPTADAAVGILPAGASVNGAVTIQRYMAIEGVNGGRIYRYIASPIIAATVADLQAEIPVSGTFTGRSNCSGCGTNQSMFSYYEPTIVDTNGNGISNFDDGYIDFPENSNTETLTPGRGYALFVRGNTLTTARWDVRGKINAGNTAAISLPVSFTSTGIVANDGWNLVGNPFPSTIDWNAVSGWTKANVNASIYIRDNSVAGGQFATWNGLVGTNGGSRYIAMGQAFWVKANAATPVLTANENVKAPGTQTNFFRAATTDNLLRVTLMQGNIRDEAVIHFRADATNAFDPHADAMKLPNTGFNLSTQVIGGEKLAINSLDQVSCTMPINLVIENIAVGNYSLTFDGISSYASSTTMQLNDTFTGASVDLRQSNTYAFSVTNNAASSSATRFTLTIVQTESPMNYTIATTDVCPDQDAKIEITETSKQNIYEVFVNDKRLSEMNGKDGTMSLSVASSLLSLGANQITVRATPRQGCGSKTEKVHTVVVEEIVNPASVTTGTTCREGTVTLNASGAQAGQQYRWYGAMTDDTQLGSDAVFVTPVLTQTTTYFVSIANTLGCEGERVPVEAKVIAYENPVIDSFNDSLHVNFSGTMQWYVDGNLLPHDTTSTIKPMQSGIYTVAIPVQTCLATASMSYTMPEVITGIGESTSSMIRVYPNPVAEFLFFEKENDDVEEVTIQSVNGAIVGRFNLTRSEKITTGKFDMSALSSGLYFVNIRSSDKKTEIKVIKQ